MLLRLQILLYCLYVISLYSFKIENKIDGGVQGGQKNSDGERQVGGGVEMHAVVINASRLPSAQIMIT